MRTPVSRVAVACTAALASAFVGISTASAEDADVVDETVDTTDTQEPSVDETSDEDVDAQDSGEDPAEADPADEDDDVTAEAVEPVYGFQKFRVGVTTGRGVPDSLTAEGSRLEIVLTPSDFEDFPGLEGECEVGAPDEDGISWCVIDDVESDEDLDETAPSRASRVIVEPDVDLPSEQAFTLPPGSTAIIRQLSAPDGLEPSDEIAAIEPCEGVDSRPICGEGDPVSPDFEIEATTAVFVNDLVDDGSGTGADGATDDDTLLPDTGAPSGAGLALGAGMVAAGGYLLTRGRRRSDASAA